MLKIATTAARWSGRPATLRAAHRFAALRPATISMAAYGFSVAFGKGLSLLMLPFVARLMPPAEFARLDVTASFLEVSGIVAAFAVSDLLFRFLRKDGEGKVDERAMAALLGVVALCAAGSGLLTQVFVPTMTEGQTLIVSNGALRLGLVSAACTGIIELPLAWLRFRDRPFAFCLLVCGRSGALAAVMLAVLLGGGGATEVVACNALVDISIALALFGLQMRRFGLALSGDMLRNARRYGLPMVAGSLAMFGLGALDRWFLQARVDPATLAHYALAAKLALATPLVLQPFLLWWLPRRIPLTETTEGLKASARLVGFGAAILVCGATAVAFAGNLFVTLVLPPAYAGAAAYVPALIVIAVLNETVTLVNVGSFARPHGREILLVNGTGGVVAVLGYMALIPAFGLWGAIGATVVGHLARLALFGWLGRRSAPIAYPLGVVLPLALLAAVFVAISPDARTPVAAVLFSCAALTSLVLGFHRGGLLPPTALLRGGVRGVG